MKRIGYYKSSLVGRISSASALFLLSWLIAYSSLNLQTVFAASAPNYINYQGRLLNTNGVPVSSTTASITFALYDSSAGGTCLWSNSSSTCVTTTARTVTLTDGLFSENLGDTTLGTPYAAIPDTVFANNASVYLEVIVNGETLSPRKQFTAAPFALNSDSLDGLDATTVGATSSAVAAFDSNGALQITGNPTGSGVSQGVLYINPASADTTSGDTLLGLAVGGVSKFSFLESGVISQARTASGQWLSFNDGTDTFGIYNSAGTPEGSITGNTGSLALDTTNGTLYVKTDDGDNTGWSALGSGSGDITSIGDVTSGAAFDGTAGNVLQFEGSTADGNEITLTAADPGSDFTLTLPAITSTLVTLDGNQTFTGNLSFEGSSADANETTFSITDPTSDQTITFPDATGTVLLSNTGWQLGGNALTADSVFGSTTNFDIQLQRNGSNYLVLNDTAIDVSEDLVPTVDDTYALGSALARWSDVYVGPATVHIGTSATDEGTISYDTASNVLNFGTDAVANGDIAFFTDDLYLDKSLGFIGIGNSNPANNLDITGTVGASGNVTLGAALTVAGSSTFNGSASFNGVTTIGDNGDTVEINSSDWNITPTGELTGVGPISSDGALTFSGAFTDISTAGADSLDLSTGTGAINLIPGGSITQLSIDSNGVGAIIDLGASLTTGSINLGTSLTSGTIVIGPTGATNGNVNIFPGSGSGTLLIANGNGTGSISIATGTAARTITIGGTGANTVNIANSQTSGSISIGGSISDTLSTISVGAVSGASAAKIDIGTGTAPQIINLGAGTGNKTIAIGNSVSTGGISINTGGGTIDIGQTSSARSINIGTGAALQTITIGGTGANSIIVGSGQTNGSISIGASLVAGTMTIGGTAATGDVNIAVSNANNTVNFASGSGATNINIGTGGGSTKTIRLGTGASANDIEMGSITTTAFDLISSTQVTITGSATTCSIGNGVGATSCTSDARLKQNITNIDSTVLDSFMSLRPISYNWNDNTNFDQTVDHLGFIAQEVDAIFPDSVQTVYNDPLLGDVYGVDYASLIVPTIASVQIINSNLESLLNANYQSFDTDSRSAFAARFFERLAGWLSDSANGIVSLFTNRLETREICLLDSNGRETCLNKTDIDNIVNHIDENDFSVPSQNSVNNDSSETENGVLLEDNLVPELTPLQDNLIEEISPITPDITTEDPSTSSIDDEAAPEVVPELDSALSEPIDPATDITGQN